jgi:glycosyltransferase involved in cell wall biosynthesis
MELTNKISAVVITFNEEKNIGRCLKSLQEVADEIIVVDSNSTDRTVVICEGLGVKVITQPFLGYVEQKNFAMQQARFDYVLSLDADEALSEELKNEIIKEKNNLLFDAYRFNRLNNFFGKWLRHGQWYPDRKTRLWNKNKAQWGGTNPHDQVILPKGATVKTIKKDILHFAYYQVQDHVDQINKFAKVYAKASFLQGKKVNVLIHVLLSPIFKFIKRYIFKFGFLDGYYGFIACYNAAILNYYKYIYLRELNKKKLD